MALFGTCALRYSGRCRIRDSSRSRCRGKDSLLIESPPNELFQFLRRHSRHSLLQRQLRWKRKRFADEMKQRSSGGARPSPSTFARFPGLTELTMRSRGYDESFAQYRSKFFDISLTTGSTAITSRSTNGEPSAARKYSSPILRPPIIVT